MCGSEKKENGKAIWSMFAVATILAGCEFDSSGLGPGPSPDPGCTLDFKVTQMHLDLEPDYAGIQTDGTLMEDQPFEISWSWHYNGVHDFDGIYIGPYEYMTRIRINQGDEVVFETEFASDPIDVGDYNWDVMEIEDGLPPGSYEAEILLDPYGDVPECFDLGKALNNWGKMEFTVEVEPIEGLSSGPGGR